MLKQILPLLLLSTLQGFIHLLGLIWGEQLNIYSSVTTWHVWGSILCLTYTDHDLAAFAVTLAWPPACLPTIRLSVNRTIKGLGQEAEESGQILGDLGLSSTYSQLHMLHLAVGTQLQIVTGVSYPMVHGVTIGSLSFGASVKTTLEGQKSS